MDEFVYMTENGYSKDEILKGERIIMQTLDFTVSAYCSPYSWVRKISKADDYDIQTRTLSKFLMEVTLLDHRFIRCKPSMVAAIGMYLARKMLNGDWVSLQHRICGFVSLIWTERGFRLLLELHRSSARSGRPTAVRAIDRRGLRVGLRLQEVRKQEVPPRIDLCSGLGYQPLCCRVVNE